MDDQSNGNDNGTVYGPPFDPDLVEAVERAERQLDAAGERVTQNAIERIVGGKHARVRACWQWLQAQRSPVAVAEAPEPSHSPTAEALQDDLRQLETQYEAWHLALERLWELDQKAPLDEQREIRQVSLERLLTKNLQRQEELRLALEVARLKEEAEAAVLVYDSAIDAAQVLAEATLRAVSQLAQVLAAFVQHLEVQGDALALIRSHDGHQQFPISGGLEEVVNFVGRAFPSDHRAVDMVRLLLSNPPTQGRGEAALSECPRLFPFPPRLVERYIASLTPEGVPA